MSKVKQKTQFQIFIKKEQTSLIREIKKIIKEYPCIESLEDFSIKSDTAATVKFKLKFGYSISVDIRKCKVDRCLTTIRNYLNDYFDKNLKKIEQKFIKKAFKKEDYKEIENILNKKIEDKRITVKISRNVQVFYDEEKQYTKPLLELIDISQYYTCEFNQDYTTSRIIPKKTKEKIYSSIAKKLFTNLKSVKIEEKQDSNLEKVARDLYKEYAYNNFLMLNTKCYKNRNIDCSHSLLNLIQIEINTNEFIVYYKNNNIEIRYKPSFRKYYNTVKSKEFQQAANFFENYFKKINYKIDNVDGEGFWFGNTTLLISSEKWEESYSIKINNPYIEAVGIDDWLNNVKNSIKDQISQIEDKIKKEQKAIYELTAKYRYSFISRDIIKFIQKNEDYITENAVIQYMRGNQVQLNTYILELQDFIPYKNYSKEEIEKILIVLIKENILKKRTCNGKYGKFYTLHLNENNYYKQILVNINEDELNCDPFNDNAFNDFEAEKIFFEYEKKINIEIKDYIMLLKLINVKGFILRYYDEYICLMKSAPKEFKSFVKMKIDNEEDKLKKKILKEIVKNR